MLLHGDRGHSQTGRDTSGKIPVGVSFVFRSVSRSCHGWCPVSCCVGFSVAGEHGRIRTQFPRERRRTVDPEIQAKAAVELHGPSRLPLRGM